MMKYHTKKWANKQNGKSEEEEEKKNEWTKDILNNKPQSK